METPIDNFEPVPEHLAIKFKAEQAKLAEMNGLPEILALKESEDCAAIEKRIGELKVEYNFKSYPFVESDGGRIYFCPFRYEESLIYRNQN